MQKWSWYWNYNPLGPLYFWETKHCQKKNNILIRIFEFFIISFLLLEKKDLMLVSINIQSCVQLSIQSLRRGPLILWKEYLMAIFFFYYFIANSFFCCLEIVFSGKTNKNSCQSFLEKSEPVQRTNYICYFFCWRKYILNVFLNLVSSSLLLGEVIVRQCFAFLF